MRSQSVAEFQQRNVVARRGDERGFTALELVVNMTIALVLLSIAVPAYVSLRVSGERRSASDSFEGDLRRARHEAIAQGARTILTPTATGYTVGIDAAPFSATGTPDDTLFERELPSGIAVTSSGTIIFDARGFLITSAGIPTTITAHLSFNGGDTQDGTISAIGVLTYSAFNGA